MSEISAACIVTGVTSGFVGFLAGGRLTLRIVGAVIANLVKQGVIHGKPVR